MNLIDRWNVRGIDKHELHKILTTHFTSLKPSKNGIEFYRDSDLSFTIKYSKKGNILEIKPESITKKEIDIIRDKISEGIINNVGSHFYRRIAFFRQPIDGFYRAGDSFQLVPVPPDAPVQNHWVNTRAFSRCNFVEAQTAIFSR